MERRRFGTRERITPAVAIVHQVKVLNLADHDALEKLNTEVSDAIAAAEKISDQNSPAARTAYAHLSALEERISKLTVHTSVEGAVARRGAVRAALRAGDERRALGLAATYVHESNDDQLREDLHKILDDHYKEQQATSA